MEEKYKEVIDNLLEKYGGTVDKGFEMLKAMARAYLYGEENLYEPDVEFDKEELLKDYKEYLDKAEKVASEKGLI